MKQVPLTKGYFVLVDDEDFDRVMRFKWQAQERNHTVYAQHLGCFKSEVEAALAYDRAAREASGEFAFCNFPVESHE